MESCERCHAPVPCILPVIDIPLCPSCWVHILECLAWPEVCFVLAELQQTTPLDVTVLPLLIDAWRVLDPAAPRFVVPLPRTRAQEVDRWYDWKADRKQYEALAAQVGPLVEFPFLVIRAVRARRQFRRKLRSQFRYNAVRRRFLRGGGCLYGLTSVRHYTALCQGYSFYQELLCVCFEVVLTERAARKGLEQTVTQATQAMRSVLDALPHCLTGGLGIPEGALHEEESLRMTGYMRTQIRKNTPRLLKALESERRFLSSGERQSYEEILLERLPPHIFLAWHEYKPNEHVLALKKRILKNLTQDAPPTASRNKRHGVLPERLSMEEFWLREEARMAMDLDNPSVRTQLTKRQLELCDVMSELLGKDEEITYAKIAARMGIEENTVKAMTSQIRARLRPTASA